MTLDRVVAGHGSCRRRSCCRPFKTIRALPPHAALSPHAMPIWDGSTKRASSLRGKVERFQAYRARVDGCE